MDRSLWAVIGGTFTLRFSTGLTGAMLAVYLAKLPEHGGQPVDAFVVGVFAATFYLAELVLSPVFGALSDRIGHHKVMLYGPVFGAVAVILTAFTTNLLLLGGTRWLEGASTAASVPSILGYIAMVTANDQALRGRAAARFEGATLLGLAAGIVVAPVLFAAIGPAAFLLNALVYGISFLIYWRGVKDPAGEAQTLSGEHGGVRRYGELLRSSHVWLLAPTWIAVNASIGLWLHQSIFQLTAANPEHPDQLLHGGFEPWQISLGALVVGLIFGAGLLYWGGRFKRYRRTTIILYGILGGAALVVAGLVINHSAGIPPAISLTAALVAVFGLFVLAGATPAALGLLADVSERFPTDRGAIMGLYSVFLAIGQITGAVIGGRSGRHRWHRRDVRRHARAPARGPDSARPAPARRALCDGHRRGRGVRRRSGLRRPAERVRYCRSAGGRLRSHDAATGPSLTTAEARVTSNVGQNYPYTSETEADRATSVKELVEARSDLGEKLASETTPLDDNERWWVWKCPTPGCRGLLHVAGYAAEKHALFVVCDGECAKTFLR